MEEYIKRINLSFDIRRQKDKQVYEIISSQHQKTAYIINVILSSVVGKQEKIDKKILKEALKEVLDELQFDIDLRKTDEIQNIPNNIFDIFENM